MSLRTEKVASVIKRMIVKPVEEIGRENGAGLVTVTSVRISPDLQSARVYISVYGGKVPPAHFITILEQEKNRVKHYMAPQLKLRFMPDIKFFLDDTLDQMERIQKLISDSEGKTNGNTGTE